MKAIYSVDVVITFANDKTAQLPIKWETKRNYKFATSTERDEFVAVMEEMKFDTKQDIDHIMTLADALDEVNYEYNVLKGAVERA